MTAFDIPNFAVGQGRTFRISASRIAGRGSVFACPASIALEARRAAGSLLPRDPSGWRRTWDDASKLHFAIRDAFQRLGTGPSNAELAAAEPKLTHAQQRFVRHAVEHLQELVPLASQMTGVELEIADDLQAPANLSELAGDVTLFARHLASRDGLVHEVVRMRLRPLKLLTDGDHDWTAVAAVVLMKAIIDHRLERIRVSDFSLADGEYRITFDGTPKDALRLYASRGALLPAALNGHDFNPGTNCADCGFLYVCPAVPQRRGMLGIPRRAVATRALTATDLAAYNRCPTAFLAQRRDHLPAASREDDDDLGAAARGRGIAAHAVLRWLHARVPAVGCTLDDLPDPLADPEGASALAEHADVDVDAYATAHPYLRHHIDNCLLGYAGFDNWLPEERFVVFDPDADIVVVTTPDLTGKTHHGEPIWRETKTATAIPPDVEAAFELYPGSR